MDQGFWNNGIWIPADGNIFHNIPASQVLRHYPNLSIRIVGDSTMRFHYSAWLDFFNISHDFPHHFINDNDSCAFSKVGWPIAGPCANRWRGPCRDNMINCIYSHSYKSINITFEWWRHGLSLPKNKFTYSDIVILSTGVWEAKAKYKWKRQTLGNIQRLHRSNSGKHTFIMSNGICAGGQRAFWTNVTSSSWPGSSMEERVRECNTVLKEYSNTNRSIIYIDRVPSMYVPYNITSPCFHHHPYGMMSDLHIQFVLHALFHEWKVV